jgi:class 3 adenylate cyclase
MWPPLAVLLRRAAAIGWSTADSERDRLAKSSVTLMVLAVCLASPIWVLTYLVLNRPLAAAIPGAYVAVSAASLLRLSRTSSLRAFAAIHIGLMLVLPFALQWSLGGFVNGSGVALWAFAAPLAGLVVWGRRAAAYLFGGFVLGVIASGLAEPWLRSAVEPPPAAVANAFLVLNLIAPMATALLSVAYFMRLRDAASARSEELLLNVLPERVAERLKRGEQHVADRVAEASVLFVDIAGFTPFAERTSPDRMVILLGRIFSTLDGLAERHGLDKIKTLGDGYLAVAGLGAGPGPHAECAAYMALEVQPALHAALGRDWPDLELRVGIASGPVVAGVIGSRRFSYDVWGDTVNTASRMTSSTDPRTIQIAASTRQLLGDRWPVARQAEVAIKGKGLLTTYLLLGSPRDGS